MRLKPLYRVRFDYPESWAVELSGEMGKEEHHYFLPQGRTEGRLTGTFRGANFPRRRSDQTFVPDFRGVIVTDDGATVLFEYHGYGRAYVEPYKTESPGIRQVVISATHLSQDPRYRWLNDVVCVGTGEVRRKAEGFTESNPTNLTIDVAEVVWEPLPGFPSSA